MTQAAAKPFTTHADNMNPSKEKVGNVVETLISGAPRNVDEIYLNRLHENPDNPREQIGDVEDLAASVGSVGILEPLLVATAKAYQAADDRLPALEDGDYVVIAGHRRLAAAALADLDTVPCIVRDDLVGADAEVAMLIENLHREDLTPIEEAKGFEQLRSKHGKTQQQIADMTGYNQSHVSKRLALIKLPEDLQAKAGTAALPLEDAIAIAKHSDDPEVMKAIANRPNWKSIEQAASDAARNAERNAKLAEAKKSIKDRSLTFIDNNKVGYSSYQSSCEVTQLEREGVDVTDHLHRDCHAVTLQHKYAPDQSAYIVEVEVCTNPKGHPDSPSAKATAQRAKIESTRAKEAAAANKRRDARLEVVKSAVAKIDAATDLLVDQIIYALAMDARSYVSELCEVYEHLIQVLGITVPEPAEGEADDDDGFDRSIDAFTAYTAASNANLRRATAAWILTDQAVEAESNYGTRSARKAFLEWLQVRGYKLTAVEKQRLKEASA